VSGYHVNKFLFALQGMILTIQNNVTHVLKKKNPQTMKKYSKACDFSFDIRRSCETILGVYNTEN
jgi:hypothetical protein